MAITKCPNCNHKVSTLAAKCPHCDTEVAGNLSYCPECNDAYINGSTICPSCGYGVANEHVAPNQGDDQSASHDANDSASVCVNQHPHESAAGNESNAPEEILEDNENNEKHHSGRFTTFALIILIGIVLTGIAIGGILYYQNMQQRQAETLAFNETKNHFTPDAAKTFLQSYPESEYADSLHLLTKEYETQQKAWLDIAESIKREDFAQYLTTYPDGYFATQAEEKLDSIDWSHTKQNATPDAIKFYMDNHIHGKHIQTARAGLNAVGAYRVNYPERAAINNAMMRFFIALSNNNTNMLTNITTQAVNAKASDLISKAEPNNRTRYMLTSTIDIDKDIADSLNTYSTSCTVLRTITTPERNTIQKAFTVKARINHEFKIEVLSMKSEIINQQ